MVLPEAQARIECLQIQETHRKALHTLVKLQVNPGSDDGS
jgi:hypothetical protein